MAKPKPITAYPIAKGVRVEGIKIVKKPRDAAAKNITLPTNFKPANTTTFITQDEESSGIVDVTSYLRTGKSDKAKYYMMVAQIHATPAKSRPDLNPAPADIANAIEGGQWYVMKINDWSSIY